MTESTGRMQETTWAIISHIGGLLGLLPSLVIYLIKKNSDDPFTLHHAKEALNFQITVTVIVFVCMLLSFIGIGPFLLPFVMIGNIIFCIIAAVSASNGNYYRYPLNIRFIR